MKKKVIKPFSLDNMMNHCIETKCGYPVELLLTDVELLMGNDEGHDDYIDTFPLFVRVKTPNKQCYAEYTKDGRFYDNGGSDLDLVLVEEQEIPSVTKEEVKEHLQWFVDNADCLIEGLGAKVHERLLDMVLAMQIAYRNRDDGIIPDIVKEKLAKTRRQSKTIVEYFRPWYGDELFKTDK